MSHIDCQITYLKDVSDTLIMRLRPSQAFEFKAGQYLFLSLDDETFKPFSIASSPTDDDLELHIRDNPDTPVADDLAQRYESSIPLKIQLPAGECTLDRVSMDRPILFIAGGTGYAPCNAMIRELLASDNRPSVSLFWGAAQSEELYLNRDLALWASQQPGFVYVPVVQFPKDEDDNLFRHGFVHEAVLDSDINLADYDIYVSGSGAMVGHVHHALVSAGADAARIYSDMLDLNLAEFPS